MEDKFQVGAAMSEEVKHAVQQLVSLIAGEIKR